MIRFDNRGNAGVGGAPMGASIGSLRYPLALLAAKNVPDLNDATWDLRLRCYARPWGDYEESSRSRVSGEDQDNKSIHVFTIRNNPRVEISAGDYVYHRRSLYLIKSTNLMRGRVDFREIQTTIHGALSKTPIVVQDDLPLTNTVVSQTVNNPFWDNDNGAGPDSDHH